MLAVKKVSLLSSSPCRCHSRPPSSALSCDAVAVSAAAVEPRGGRNLRPQLWGYEHYEALLASDSRQGAIVGRGGRGRGGDGVRNRNVPPPTALRPCHKEGLISKYFYESGSA